ncbi:MAG: flavin reductase family protein [Oscillospiraceae bacterium]|nr:flavin reductase family protein [Oscillospiraceae bacterium]
MEKVKLTAGALLSPVPAAAVTCGSFDSANIITIAWTGMISTRPPVTYISVRPERHSHGIIKETGEFAVNLTTSEMVRAVDLCGVKSGRDGDKFTLSGLHKAEASVISAPLIAESPLSLECRVREIKSFGSHDMFIADIVCVDASPEFIDENGKIDLARAGLMAYSHGEYFALGKKVGHFGFSVAKKRRKHPRGRK